MTAFIARRVAIAFVLFFAFLRPAACAAATSAGTQIENTATLTFSSYQTTYSVVSNSIAATVMAVGSLLVAPKLGSSSSPSGLSAAGQTITRPFQITNTGNIANAYVIQSVSTNAGSIVGISFTAADGSSIPVTPGQTLSPSLQPGQTLNVRVSVSTAGVSNGTALTISLIAQETVTGADGVAHSDSGQIRILVASGASFAAPQSASGNAPGNVPPPIALVNASSNAQVQPGGSIVYTLTFENVGGIAANNTVALYAMPADLHPDTSSVQLDGAPIHGVTLSAGTAKSQASLRSAQAAASQTLAIPLGNIAPLQTQSLRFTASVDAHAPLGATYVTYATLQAENAAPATSTSTSVLVGTANVVYDGVTGAHSPIAGATIRIIDTNSGAPLSLSGNAVKPNTSNSNPFSTDPDGTYGFGFGPEQYGNPAGSSTYYVLVSAPGYLNRKIQATLTPSALGPFYSVTLTALDGQALAVPGGFALSKAASTSIDALYGMLGNIPLFAPNVLTVTETSDRPVASGGDRVVFTVQVAGNGTTTLGATTIVAALPAGMVYAPGTGLLDGQHSEPTVQGRILTWTLPTLDASHTITYASVVLPDVAAGETMTSTVSADAALPLQPGASTEADTTCSVQIVAGIFSDRIIITGRVFIDEAGTGRFTRADTGVGGVRIYLEDGESVVTDLLGRFTFPAARPGMHVMRLDTTTLPANVTAYDDRSYDSRRSVRRLVHGIFDAGLMQDVNFAVRGAS